MPWALDSIEASTFITGQVEGQVDSLGVELTEEAVEIEGHVAVEECILFDELVELNGGMFSERLVELKELKLPLGTRDEAVNSEVVVGLGEWEWEYAEVIGIDRTVANIALQPESVFTLDTIRQLYSWTDQEKQTRR
jgi:hypothetical protein